MALCWTLVVSTPKNASAVQRPQGLHCLLPPQGDRVVANTVQRVTAWDQVNPRTGALEEARLDVATRDAVSGRTIFVDASVTCAHSGYEPRQRAWAGKDGVAVAFGRSGSASHPRAANLCH